MSTDHNAPIEQIIHQIDEVAENNEQVKFGQVMDQGRRILTRWYPKDLREEVRVPARHSATHGDAFFVVNLF